MKNLTSKYLLITTVVIAFIIIVFGIFAFIINNKVKEFETPNFISGEIQDYSIDVVVNNPVSNKVQTFNHTAQAGENLFVFMKSLEDQKTGFTFTYSESEYGVLVTGVNGYEADSNKSEFWKFFINETPSEVGIKDYVLKPGDVIRWEIDLF